ncbi:hypothetical protein LLEC1_03518 [Akanthomyces lecanii]|uniref:Uncharacterized protein n=1 Tax=Cordyceps confragosa TaxID=2714763 RepID=A0A179I6Q8_CORDF|nr:hypothetical protein LLEC1_03518 [Akanthomyces lecanii]
MALCSDKDIIAAGSEVDAVNDFYGSFLWAVFPIDDDFMPTFWSPAIETPASQEAPDVVFRRVSSALAEKTTLTHVVLCCARTRDLDGRPTVWDEILDIAVPVAMKVRGDEDHDPGQSLFLTVHVGAHSRFYELPGGADTARDWAPARGRTCELAEDEKAVWELWLQMRELALQHSEQHAMRSIAE